MSFIVLALVVATLMAPLLYCLVALVLDVINVVVPMPDFMQWLGQLIDPLFSDAPVSAELLVRISVLAAIPGLVLMAVAALALRRVLTTSPLFDQGELPGRAPDRTVLAEQRLANVVEEMAIAANIAPPRVLIVPGGVNAVACGRDATHVSLLVGEMLVTKLNREQMQGAMAHLVAAIAGGDMKIGLRAALTLALFGLIARVIASASDRDEFRQTLKLWRVFVAPTSRNTAELLREIADPFGHTAPATATAAKQAVREARDGNRLTWREWALMPLMGPVMLSGFLGGLVSQFMLSPLISLAWRQRKYMADAAAVRLTRDPDALAGALAAIAGQPAGVAPWAAHLAVTGSGLGQGGLFGGAIVPIFPSPERRGKALVRLGAHTAPVTHGASMPLPLAVLMVVLLSIAGALMGVVAYLLVFVSTAISMLFTVLPAALLHALLRAIGH